MENSPDGHEPEPGVEPGRAPESDPQTDPATDHLVRRLLADVRAEAPAPDDVVARLDQTLAGLVAERAGHAEVTDLAAVRGRRRRRVLVGLGAAAAFTVVAGVALPTLLNSDSTNRSTSADDQSVADLRPAGPLTLRADSAEQAVQTYVSGLDEPVETPAVAPAPSPLSGKGNNSLDSDESSDSNDSAGPTASREAPSRRTSTPLTCDEPGMGEVHPATYDGKAAVVVLTGLEGDSVLARVVVCSGDTAKDDDTQLVDEFVVRQP